MKNQTTERILFLQKEITKHDELYAQNNPLITDSEYDALYKELVELEAKHPEMRTNESPTQKIVAVMVDELKKVKHTRPVLSLDKVNSEAELNKFVKRIFKDAEDIDESLLDDGFIIEEKLDGLTIALKYEDGKLHMTITRGGGDEGEDVTHTVSQCVNVPKVIPFKGKLEVRAEAIMTYEEFERINVDGKYASPRNLASGSIRQYDANITKNRDIRVIALELEYAEGMEFKTEMDSLTFLKEQGFELVWHHHVPSKNLKELIKVIEHYETKKRETLPYMIDGMVIKTNSIAARELLGSTAKHPKSAVAYKFQSLDARSSLLDIEVQIGRTGQLTPRAKYEPVMIAGAEFQYATLHNFKNIKEKDIRIGDKILVARANDVIPQVVKSFHEERKEELPVFVEPTHCPFCSEPTVYKGEHLYCLNAHCDSKNIKKIEHFASKKALDMDSLGEKTVEIFFNEGYLRNVLDLYRLEEKKVEISRLRGFGEKSIQNIITSVEQTKTSPLHRVLVGLSIPLIGEKASKELSKQFSSMDELLQVAQENKLGEIVRKIDDFGPEMEQSLVNFFNDSHQLAFIQQLKENGLTMVSELKEEKVSEILKDKVFVVTGTLSKSRDEFKQTIEENGGKVTGSVSKKTSYLLMGDDAEGTSKHQKAVELNIPILNEQSFQNLIEKGE